MSGANNEAVPTGDENPQDAGLVSFDDTDDSGDAPPAAAGDNNVGDNDGVVVVPPADDDEEEEDDQPVALVAPNARRVLSRAWLLAHLGMACTMALALLVNGHVWNVATAGMQLPTWDQTGDGWSNWNGAWSGMREHVVERVDWTDQMMSIALWTRYRGIEGLGQFMRMNGSPVNVRIHQAQRALTRTFRPIVSALQRWGRRGMQPGVPFISCGMPVVMWRTPRSNQNTRRGDWNVQFGDWGSELQWTAFIYVAWYAVSQRRGANANEAKYLAILEVIRMVCDRFGVDVGQINRTPESFGAATLTHVPQFT